MINRKITDKPQICISTKVKNNSHICISIADNGFGMKEEVRSKMFNPFFTTKPIGKGTGIGLSISYHIVVEKHGGNINCISTLGEGTEFVIEIPIQHQHAISAENANCLIKLFSPNLKIGTGDWGLGTGKEIFSWLVVGFSRD